MKLTMKEIKKSFTKQGIELSSHVQDAMKQRGYTKRDLIQVIWNGEITEHQNHQGQLKVVIEGFDADNCPICIVIGYSKTYFNMLALVTVFPPIKEKFKRVI